MKNDELRRDLIGRAIEITHADNPGLLKIKGTIVDETKNTIKVKTEKGTKTVLKHQIRFKIRGKEIDGKKILKKTEKRL